MASRLPQAALAHLSAPRLIGSARTALIRQSAYAQRAALAN